MNLEAGILLLITNDYSVSVVELSIVLNFVGGLVERHDVLACQFLGTANIAHRS